MFYLNSNKRPKNLWVHVSSQKLALQNSAQLLPDHKLISCALLSRSWAWNPHSCPRRVISYILFRRKFVFRRLHDDGPKSFLARVWGGIGFVEFYMDVADSLPGWFSDGVLISAGACTTAAQNSLLVSFLGGRAMFAEDFMALACSVRARAADRLLRLIKVSAMFLCLAAAA